MDAILFYVSVANLIKLQLLTVVARYIREFSSNVLMSKLRDNFLGTNCLLIP